MKWFMVWGSSLQGHPKWIDLSLELRGAWITLMAVASGLEPRWHFHDRRHAALLLKRDGASDADAIIEALVEGGWLDEVQGQLVIHDYEDWQRYPSDTPEARTERSRRSRAAHVPSAAPNDRPSRGLAAAGTGIIESTSDTLGYATTRNEMHRR